MAERPNRRDPALRVVTPSTTPICIEFVLDETGSMYSCRNQTVGGFNEYLSEQRKVQGECRLTLTKFEGGNLATPYQDLDIQMVPTMTDRMFNPGGATNLYDTIGTRIQSLRTKLSGWTEKPPVLFVVMTDGADNMSHQYNTASIKELVRELETQGWTFVFLGAYQSAFSTAEAMGFRPENTRSFETAEMTKTMQGLSAATTVYRAAGGTTKSFF